MVFRKFILKYFQIGCAPVVQICIGVLVALVVLAVTGILVYKWRKRRIREGMGGTDGISMVQFRKIEGFEDFENENSESTVNEDENGEPEQEQLTAQK
jgi:hypothetical protein